MPAAPGALAAGDDDAPLTELCPGIVTLDGIRPISATTQTYDGDATLGPFGAVSIYELAAGDADVIIGRYDQALADCATYSATLADGTALEMGYAARDLGSYGDESHTYGNAGTADGFPIDNDIILIKSGDNLAIVTALHILALADGTISKPLAEGAVVVLEGLG